MCPQCRTELKRWSDLSEKEHDHIRGLPNRDAQPLDHRITKHLFCPMCYYEAHG
ncbi:MAG: hypothetical protein ACETWT_05840 [Thermodesulfobacteriota bacterium]